MNIFLDDLRSLQEAETLTGNTIYTSVQWVVVRSYKDFKELLDSLQTAPLRVSFDHDLGHIPEDNEVEKDGKLCADHLVRICIEKGWDMPMCFIHSANPIGRQRIQYVLDDFIRYKQRIG